MFGVMKRQMRLAMPQDQQSVVMTVCFSTSEYMLAWVFLSVSLGRPEAILHSRFL